MTLLPRPAHRFVERFRGSAAARGSFWTLIGFGVNYGLRLISTLFLTRLLTPDVFGLMSLAGVFVVGIGMFSDLGTTLSVIRSKRGDDPLFLRTAWTLQVIRGIGIGIVTCLIAWPVSQLYDQPVLFPLLCAMGIPPVIDGFRSVSLMTSQRHVNLKWVTIIDAVYQLVTTAINIAMAWWLQSVWALVIGGMVGTIVRLILGYVLLPKARHGFAFDREAMAEMVSFGRWILVGTLFTYLGGQGNRAIFGLMIPIEMLGLMTIATTISWSLGQLITKLLGQVAMPTMSRILRERPQDLPQAALRIKRMLFFYVTPCYIFLSLASQPLIDLLYDPRYAEAGHFLGFQALNGAVATLSMPYQNVMLATGNSRGHSLVMGAGTLFRTVLPVAGIWIFGIYGVFVGMFLGSLVNFAITFYFARKTDLGSPFYDLVSLAVLSALFVWRWGVIG